MPKGNSCPSCHQFTAHENGNGSYKCSNKDCECLFWTTFDRPVAGQHRKGFQCFNCSRSTLHPIGMVANTAISRCSVCGATQVDNAAVMHKDDTSRRHRKNREPVRQAPSASEAILAAKEVTSKADVTQH